MVDNSRARKAARLRFCICIFIHALYVIYLMWFSLINRKICYRHQKPTKTLCLVVFHREEAVSRKKYLKQRAPLSTCARHRRYKWRHPAAKGRHLLSGGWHLPAKRWHRRPGKRQLTARGRHSPANRGHIFSGRCQGRLPTRPDTCGSAKLKEAHTKERKFEDVVKAVEQATVLVLVY